MQQITVIRFGALGDLCLTGWSIARLAAAPGREQRCVTLVTKARFADLAARMRGVDRVLALPEPGTLPQLVQLATELRRRRPDVLIDAHGVLRAHLLGTLLGRRPQARIAKDTTARLRLLRRGEAAPELTRHLRDRLDEVFDRAGLPAGEASPPLAHLAPDVQRAGAGGKAGGKAAGGKARGKMVPPQEPPILGVAPGAQWDPKRWPQEHWAGLLRLARATAPALAIRVVLGPREAAWFDGGPLDHALRELGGEVEILRDRGLGEVARGLAGCRAVVCNDSGLLHLAEAVGTPVVALFGPTVREFGYAPSLPASELVEARGLDCRPCSRNGKRPCHRGDLACLVRIEPPAVWRALAAHGPWTAGPGGARSGAVGPTV